MRTSALICVQYPRKDFYFKCVLNFDGNPKKAGRILLKNYKKFSPAFRLVQLNEIHELEPVPEECEVAIDPRFEYRKGFTTLNKAYDFAVKNYIKYIYVYRVNQWSCCKVSNGNYFVPLEELVNNLSMYV